MISRRIARKPENDNYRRLANYIAGARSKTEKCLLAWPAGCWAGDEYELGILEATDTQALNSRTRKEKTYHLIVSFRPEDEAKLTSDAFKEIEASFAAALGFEEHQRHCAVHKNTNNLHLHVAYNMIHPEKLTRHEPFRDFFIRDRLCRELEKSLALSVDNGREQSRENDATSLSDGAASVEAHTGQQSFESYANERREDILAALEKASSWSDIHRALATHGLHIKPHGNGLAIVSSQGRHAIKASRFDRGFSKSNLEKRFGPYQAPDKRIEQLCPVTVYNANPLHRAPERGDLFAEYQAGIAQRKTALTLIKEQGTIARAALSENWAHKRQEIESMALTKRDKSNLIRKARQHESEARTRLAKNLTSRRKAIAEEVPYASWAKFLRGNAAQGNEVALAILRSRKQEVSPESEAPACKPGQRLAQGQFWRAQLLEIQTADSLRPTDKKELAAIARMHELAARETATTSEGLLKNFTYHIDAKGTVIFTLPSGGLVRDAGDRVFFSAHDQAAEKVAMLFAQAKWGKGVEIDGSTVLPSREAQKLLAQIKQSQEIPR